MSNVNTGPDATDEDEKDQSEATTLETDSSATEGDTETIKDSNTSDDDHITDESEGEAFPRKVVENLRRESASYRDRAKTAEARADELSRALFTAHVSATGILADATDLEYNADLLGDAEALTDAINGLVDAKPYLKARRVSGSVGQGNHSTTAEPFSLLNTLKGVI